MGLPDSGPRDEVTSLFRAEARRFTLALALAAPFAQGAPPAPWIEVKAPPSRLVVVTDAGEKAGRKAALQLTQFDRALQKRFPWIQIDDAPQTTVFATADEFMVRSMAPDTTRFGYLLVKICE